MSTLAIIDTIIIVCILYLLVLFKDKKYQLLLPCTIHTITWLFTAVFIHFTITGAMGEYSPDDPLHSFDYVAPMLLGMVISSIVGFTLAHSVKSYKLRQETHIDIEYVDIVLKKFHWILYMCLILGVMQFVFLYMAVGLDNLGDYRVAAVTLERTGIGKISSIFSGHAMFLGVFYISLLAYKQSHRGIEMKVFLMDSFMLASTNLAIAGRAWIVTALLPYFIVYFWQQNAQRKKLLNKDVLKLGQILIAVLIAFSVIGLVRNEAKGDEALDKFLYYTDGCRVANLVMANYPESTFDYELGASEFLYKWTGSPMWNKYSRDISGDIGLSVTVPSTIPYLYFDFGKWGGIIFWALHCFIIEVLCVRFRQKKTILSILMFMLLSRYFFGAPIGPMFMVQLPAFEWMMILYVFRKRLFPAYLHR